MRAFFHHLLLAVILLPSFVFSAHSQERYPVHVMVELPSPHSVYLDDYVTGSRDRMVVTLLNRDAMRAELEVKLELEVSGVGFRARSRGEVYHSRLVLDAGVPLRLGSETLGEYLRQGAFETEGVLDRGRLPVGMTEFRVRAVDYATGRALSEWASRRIWLDERKPPVLNSPGDGESLAWKEQQRIRFGWMPMHAGMSGTEYEIVIKEIPDNGVPASESFSYGRELLRERTRRTFHIHDMGYEPLYAGRRYAWQVRALAAEGAEPVSYANGGYSEIWSFTVDERMLSPVGLNAEAKPGRVKLMWGAVPGSSGYVVQMREKSGERDYEWKETESADEGTEFHNLRNGWAYEWRVGSRNGSGRRYWSGVSEFVVPERAEDLLKDCGKVPGERSLSGEPYLGLKVGDIVTVGGDYPMEVTEVTSLGDGWYSGEGRTRIRSIIDAPVRLVFDRVRINTELCQTDGEVKVGYDESNGLIVETDRLDDGGEGIKGKSGVSYPEGYVEAVFPESPEFVFVEGSGELRFKDAEGRDQVFRLGDASLQGEGEDGRKIGGEVGFPVLLTDKNGTTYKVYPKEGSDSTGHRQMVCEKLERLEGFDSSRLSLGAGEVRFEKGDGEYGFDAGEEKWYAKSVKLDRYYKASGRGYIAPWKLLPKGRRDHVVARYVGSGRVKPGAVRFATKDGTVLKSEPLKAGEEGDKGEEGEEEPSVWKVWLDGTERGSSYEVYAVSRGKSIGKLNVMGTDEREMEVTIVPVNGIGLDEDAIEEGLGRIYGPAGVRVKVRVDRKMTGDMDWDSDGDGRLLLAGGGSWYEGGGMKESSEMVRLQKSYESKGTEGSGAVLFVLDGASGEDGGEAGLLGEMPRRNRYGYVFAGEGTGTESLVRTMAHELGHGVFTLRHTFDGEYGGDGSRGATGNLMDYGEGTGLAAFQWNVMGNPAILTSFDKEEDIQYKPWSFLDGTIIDNIQGYEHLPKAFCTPMSDTSFIILPKEARDFTFNTRRKLIAFTIENERYSAFNNAKTDVFEGYYKSLKKVGDIYRNLNNEPAYKWVPDGEYGKANDIIIYVELSEGNCREIRIFENDLTKVPSNTDQPKIISTKGINCLKGRVREFYKYIAETYKAEKNFTPEKDTALVNLLSNFKDIKFIGIDEVDVTDITVIKFKNLHVYGIDELIAYLSSLKNVSVLVIDLEDKVAIVDEYLMIIEISKDGFFDCVKDANLEWMKAKTNIFDVSSFVLNAGIRSDAHFAFNFLSCFFKHFRLDERFWNPNMLNYNDSIASILGFLNKYSSLYGLFNLFVQHETDIRLEQYEIAFIAGLWDGIMDQGKGLSDLGALLADDPRNNWKKLEEMVDMILRMDKSDLIEVISSSFESAKEFHGKIHGGGTDNYKMAYAIGYDAVFIASFYIGIGEITSIAKAGSLSAGMIKSLEILSRIPSRVLGTGVALARTPVTVARLVAKLPTAGKDAALKVVEVAKKIYFFDWKSKKLIGEFDDQVLRLFDPDPTSSHTLIYTKADLEKAGILQEAENEIRNRLGGKMADLVDMASKTSDDAVKTISKGVDDAADAAKTAQKAPGADEVVNAASKVSEKVLSIIKSKLPKLFSSGFTESDLSRILTDDEIERLSRHLGYSVGKEELPKLLKSEEDLLSWRGIIRDESYAYDFSKEPGPWSKYLGELKKIQYFAKGQAFEDAITYFFQKEPNKIIPLFKKITGKDISNYKVFSQVGIRTPSSYSIADLVLVNRNDDEIVDIVIIECKLNTETLFTPNQKELFGIIISEKQCVLELTGNKLGKSIKKIPISSDNIFVLRDHGNPIIEDLNDINKLTINKITTVK